MKYSLPQFFSFLKTSLQIYFLKKKDKNLIKELEHQDTNRTKREKRIKKQKIRNQFLAKILKEIPIDHSIPKKIFQQIDAYLTKQNTYKIKFLTNPWLDTDQDTTVWKNKKITTLQLTKASETTQWPMGHQIWIRDLVRISRCMLQSARLNKSSHKNQKEGLHVLMSALTLMSSESQLKRFQAIIRSSQPSFINEKGNWPSIFISRKDLCSMNPDRWAQKQDALQMLALELIEAIEKKELSIEDLSEKQKEFLGFLIPFLAKIQFWKQPNSGSWEELEAIRTSVVALDSLLISKLSILSKQKEFSFIKKTYQKAWESGYFSQERYSYTSEFSKTIEILLEKGTQRLLKKDHSLVLQECQYPLSDPRFRSSDATIIYLLDYPVLDFLAKRQNKDSDWIETQEKRILKSLETLEDSINGGIKRYLLDAYMDGNQESNYFDNKTSYCLTKKVYAKSASSTISGANEAAANQFLLRRKEVSGNAGTEANWVHPVAQIASWAGRRYLETKNKSYQAIQHKFYRQLIGLITDENEKTISNEGPKNTSLVKSIQKACVPEAYITFPTSKKGTIRCAGSHSPLNWAVAETIRATAYLKESLDI